MSEDKPAVRGTFAGASDSVAPHRRSALQSIAAGATVVFVLSMMFSMAIVQISAVVMMVLWLATVWRQPRTAGACRIPFLVPVLVLTAARMVSIAFSVSPTASLPALWIELAFVPVYFALVRFLRDGTIRPDLLARLLVVAAIVAAATGIVRYAFGIAPRASSTTSGYYTLGLYLTAALPVILLLGKTMRLPGPSWSWVAGVGLVAAGLILTMNRLHWVAGAALVGGIVLWRERRLALPLLVLVVLAITVVPPVANRFEELLNVFVDSSGRDVLWRGAGLLAFEHPVTGFGPRTFSLIFPLYGELPDKGIGGWHNDYLQSYMESGVIGLTAMLWLFAAIVRSGVQSIKVTAPGSIERTTVIALLLSLSVFVMVGGFYDTIGGLQFKLLLALFAITIPMSLLQRRAPGIT